MDLGFSFQKPAGFHCFPSVAFLGAFQRVHDVGEFVVDTVGEAGTVVGSEIQQS